MSREDERNDLDPQERREAFQRLQLDKRLDHSDMVRRENYRRQDEREATRRQEDAQREASRAVERSRSRGHSQAMYDNRRADKLDDDNTKMMLGAEEQKEVTRREMLLSEIGARLYRKKLNDDYEHDIRTRNLDIQEHQTRTEIDTTRTTTIDDNTARNARREIREHLRGALIEKIADHYTSEHAKRTAAAQELKRMEDESRHSTTKIREESSAKEREMWVENEGKKDYELFMVNLRRQTNEHTTGEIENILKKLNDID